MIWFWTLVAGEVYRDLRDRVVNNVMKEYYRWIFWSLFKVGFTLILLRTGFVWEQYNDRTGEGQVRRNLAVKFMILENTYLNDQQNLTFLFRAASLLLGGLRWLYLWWERHTEDCLARKRTSDSDILCVLCYLLGDVTYLWDEGNQYQFFHRFTFFRRFCLLPFGLSGLGCSLFDRQYLFEVWICLCFCCFLFSVLW